MRLAYLTTRYPAVSHTFIRRELRELEARGHHVLRLSIRPPAIDLVDPLDRAEMERTLSCINQPIHRLLTSVLCALISRPTRALSALALACRMGLRSERGLLRHLAYLVEATHLLRVLRAHSIEHVHVHFGTNPAAVARLIRRLGGPPFSMTIHGPGEFDAPRSLDLAGKIADAAFVVAITEFCALQLQRWAAPTDWHKIHIVHCTVGQEFFAAACPVTPSSKAFLCVGRLAPAKGHHLLLEALARVVRREQSAQLVLAGDGDLRGALESQIRRLNLQKHVSITGWISEYQVRQHLLAARALVLSSIAEGLPMVIMEAFALCRPVISTSVAGIPELVRHDENGWLVPVGDVERLADALCDALTRPSDVLTRMGERGQSLVRERFHSATETDRLEALLQAATRRRGSPQPRHALESFP